MFALCEGALIEKTRYRIVHEGHTWDVDVFSAANAGLALAEIELDSEEEVFARPRWLGAEVSTDQRFTNAQLSLAPYDAATWTLPTADTNDC
jgi:adenylate cyclase